MEVDKPRRGARQDIIALSVALTACQAACPDQRIGQIVENAVGEGLFFIEDEELARELLAYAKRNS